MHLITSLLILFQHLGLAVAQDSTSEVETSSVSSANPTTAPGSIVGGNIASLLGNELYIQSLTIDSGSWSCIIEKGSATGELGYVASCPGASTGGCSVVSPSSPTQTVVMDIEAIAASSTATRVKVSHGWWLGSGPTTQALAEITVSSSELPSALPFHLPQSLALHHMESARIHSQRSLGKRHIPTPSR